MPCNCGGKKPKNAIYIHTNANGVQHSYATEIECAAAVLREGGSCRVEEKG